MSGFTPNDIRLAFAESFTLHTMEEPHLSRAYEVFDRFIAKVKADALREAAQQMRGHVNRARENERFTEHELVEHGVEHVLTEYADLIEEES